MALKEIFLRETRDTILSKRFLIYLTLLFLPLIMNVWFSWMMYENPSIIQEMTSFLPEPILIVNPMICMMSYLDMATFSIALIAVLHSSDFIAGEQSRGMLTLLVSKPLHRWELIVGKYISFMIVFLPLLTLNILLMAVAINVIGIGAVKGGVLGGYIFAVLFYGIVFTSIGTLFSVLSKRTSIASLGTMIFLILWMIFDFMNLYLPKTTADLLNTFSLSHYINKVLGFISNGKAGIFVTGGILENPSIEIFMTSLFAILVILTLIPVLLSIIIFQKKDIKNR